MSTGREESKQPLLAEASVEEPVVLPQEEASREDDDADADDVAVVEVEKAGGKGQGEREKQEEEEQEVGQSGETHEHHHQGSHKKKTKKKKKQKKEKGSKAQKPEADTAQGQQGQGTAMTEGGSKGNKTKPGAEGGKGSSKDANNSNSRSIGDGDDDDGDDGDDSDHDHGRDTGEPRGKPKGARGALPKKTGTTQHGSAIYEVPDTMPPVTAISGPYNSENNPEELADGYQRMRSASTRSMSNVRSSTVCGYAWVATLALIIFGFIPWGAIELHKHNQQTHVIAWFVAGVFVCLAVPMTLWDIAMHLRHWNNPQLQRHIIRILFMVPIYAIDSWLALRFPDINIYFDVARETYEAYVIYNFYVYLLAFLRQRPDFDIDIHKRDAHPHMFPCCCLKPWRMGQPFLNACTHGVTSYVVVRLLTTIIAFASALGGRYGDGEIATDKAFVWVAIFNSISQAWAMYCLVLFYYAFKPDLKPMRPLYKFITIKAVIFFSFWQSVLIAILVSANVIKESKTWTYYTQESVAAGLQDFLICIEMFLAALAHHKVFSYREHLTDDDRADGRLSFRRAVVQLLDVRDVAHTVFDHVQTVYTLDGKLANRRMLDASGEHTALLTGQAPSLLSEPQPPSDGAYGSVKPASNV